MNTPDNPVERARTIKAARAFILLAVCLTLATATVWLAAAIIPR